jgi:periplasmic protein TonB
VIYKAVPVFPPTARAANTEGEVVVEVTIDGRGEVIAAKATSGPVLLRAAAEEAALKWKFRPGTRNGTPVQTSQTILFNFRRRSN